jgi:hypothetical protein
MYKYSSLAASTVSPSDDNEVTVLASNCTAAHHAGAMLIKPSHLVAITGVTTIFIMDGTPTKNKRPAMHPLLISLLDSRKVTSTHICDITIPGLPIKLTGPHCPGDDNGIITGYKGVV